MMFARPSRLYSVPPHIGSALSLATAGMDSRWGRWLLRCLAPVWVVLLGGGLSWASFSLTFQGLVRPLDTGGGITLSAPSGIVVDAAGNVYVVDTGNSRIVAVNPQGVATVLTINGLSPALTAPNGIAIDGSGNLYIADTGNNRVVKVDTSGNGTVVSTGGVTLSLPKGVALDQSGNFFIADTGNNRIVEVTSGGSAAALAITVSSGSATLNGPIGVAVNVSGKLYIADSNHNRVVTVAAGSTTGVVVSILGGVTLNNPGAVAVDRIGNVIIADSGNSRIAEVDTAGNGTVLFTDSQSLSGPRAMAVDVFGTVYIADTGNSRGLVVNPQVNGNLTSSDPTYSLNQSAVGFGHVQLGASSGVTLTLPFTIGGVALGSVKVLTAGTQNLDFIAGSGTTCSGTTGASTSCSVEITFLPTAPGLRKGAVVLFDNSSAPLLTIPLFGFSDSPVAALAPNTGTVISTGALATVNPYQITQDGSGNLYVGDYTGKNVTRVAAGGGSASAVSLGTPGGTAIQNLTGVALDGAGNLFIGDHQNSRILVVTPGGVVSVLTINGLSPALGFPTALAFDGAGNLYIADFTSGRVVEISTLVVAGGTASGKGTVVGTGSFSFTGSTLTGMTVDAQGTIYFAARTQNSSSIIKVTAAGVASVLAIPGNITPAISNPQGVGVDAMGNVYVVDTGHSRIVEITTAGVASVLSISGLPTPTTLSALLFGVTVDAAGNLYIPDWTNNRLVFVNVSGAPLAFASTKVGLTSTDSPKTANVTNLGNQPLLISADPTYTADFSQPAGATSQCLSSTSLASGTACNVSVQFTPQSVGSLSAGVAVTDNTLNVEGSTQQVSVSGTGTNPGDTTAVAVSTSPASASIGQPLTVTATVTDTTTGHSSTIPTGAVTFSDLVGSTSVSLNSGNPVTLSAGAAVLTGATLSGVGTHTITANYAGVSGSFTSSANTTTLTVSKDTAAVAGPATQPVQITVGQTGSVPITVTGPYSTVALPSGLVTYSVLDSSSTSVASGSLTLAGGITNSTASVPLASSLAAGTYTVNISYDGDTNYAASTTATAIQVRVGEIDFALSIPSGSPTTATVSPGGTATYLLTVAPVSGSTFQSAVALTVSGLPSGATATITPQTLAAGTGSTNVTLVVQLPQQAASLRGGNFLTLNSAMLMVGMLLLPFGGTLRRVRHRHKRKLRLLLLIVAGIAAGTAVVGLTGCGARNSGFFGSPQQSYVITVTATSGTLSHSTTLNLTVR